MVRYFAIVLVCIFSSILLGSKPIPKVINVSLGVNDTHFEYHGMLEFKKYVEDKSEGSILIELFPDRTLGDDKEALDKMSNGSVHMNLPSLAVLANYVPEFNLFSLPFIFETQADANKIVDGLIGQKLLKMLESSNFVGLGYGDFGFRHVSNNVKPIVNMNDFKGLKIRVMQNEMHAQIFEHLNAKVVVAPFSRVRVLIDENVIEAQENPLRNFTSSKLYEVQNYITLTKHLYDFVVFVMYKPFYDSLTNSEKVIINEGVKNAHSYMRSIVAVEDENSLKFLRNFGTQVNKFDDAGVKKNFEPFRDKHGKSINPKIYSELQSELEKLRK